jgi:hypothetical protein
MNQKTKAQSPVANAETLEAADAGRDAQQEAKPAWHAPVITRIDIKRTMNLKGSGSDSVGRTGSAT